MPRREGGLDVALRPPPPAEFVVLRAACGWGRITEAAAAAALARGCANVTVRSDGELVGFGRVVGDGVLYFYLQDVIVAEAWRGRGVGGLVVEALMGRVRDLAAGGATVGLMAARGAEPFYERFGFRARPGGGTGAGMTQVVGA